MKDFLFMIFIVVCTRLFYGTQVGIQILCFVRSVLRMCMTRLREDIHMNGYLGTKKRLDGLSKLYTTNLCNILSNNKTKTR